MSLPRFDGRTPDQQRITFSGSFLIPEAHQQAHMIGERFKIVADVEVLHIDHKATGPKKQQFVRLEVTTLRTIAFPPDGDANTLLDRYGVRADESGDQESLDV